MNGVSILPNQETGSKNIIKFLLRKSYLTKTHLESGLAPNMSEL